MITNNFKEILLSGTFFEVNKKMTSNQSINAGLLSVGVMFLAYATSILATHFWYGVVAALLGVGAFAVYELLP